MLAHIKNHSHKLCQCGGYHFKHRPGSPYCEKNPMSDVMHARRAGEPADVLLEIAIDCVCSKPVKFTKVCLF